MKLITNLVAVAAVATLVVPVFAQTSTMHKPMMKKPTMSKPMSKSAMMKKSIAMHKKGTMMHKKATMMQEKSMKMKPMTHSTMKPMAKPMMKKPM